MPRVKIPKKDTKEKYNFMLSEIAAKSGVTLEEVRIILPLIVSELKDLLLGDIKVKINNFCTLRISKVLPKYKEDKRNGLTYLTKGKTKVLSMIDKKLLKLIERLVSNDEGKN